MNSLKVSICRSYSNGEHIIARTEAIDIFVKKYSLVTDEFITLGER